MTASDLLAGLLELFILAIPVACISWTVTQEEVFREPREWCVDQVHSRKTLLARKLFYLFTCEYCFSHYVAIGALALTHFTLLLPGWRGYIISGFSLVWVANVYMSAFGRLRLEIKFERVEIEGEEKAQERAPTTDDHRPTTETADRRPTTEDRKLR
jgi:hypothetical protein